MSVSVTLVRIIIGPPTSPESNHAHGHNDALKVLGICYKAVRFHSNRSKKHHTDMSPSNIPSTQQAAVVPSIGSPIEIRHDHPVKSPSSLAPGECLVQLTHTGVCHTDLHAKQGDWPIKPNNPLIGGHEGVGKIVAIGDNTANSQVKVGDRVGIKWLANSCLDCEQCRKGAEQSASLADIGV